MILGVGNDIIDIRRIERTIERYGDRFLERVFTDTEREKSDKRRARAASYAKRFAAKEACAKALGTGIRKGVHWRDMGVVNLRSGRPTMVLTGGAAEQLELRLEIRDADTEDQPIFAPGCIQQPRLVCERAPNSRHAVHAERSAAPLADFLEDRYGVRSAPLVEKRDERTRGSLCHGRGNIGLELKRGRCRRQARDMLGERCNLGDRAIRTCKPQHGGRMQRESVLAAIGHGHSRVHRFLGERRQRPAKEVRCERVLEVRLEPRRPMCLHAEDSRPQQVVGTLADSLRNALERGLIVGGKVG